jgi:hypothetical protein
MQRSGDDPREDDVDQSGEVVILAVGDEAFDLGKDEMGSDTTSKGKENGKISRDCMPETRRENESPYADSRIEGASRPARARRRKDVRFWPSVPHVFSTHVRNARSVVVSFVSC